MITIQMISIARRAATLAASTTRPDDVFDFYREYLDQLRGDDYQCLRQWIGLMIENGDETAVEIMKLIIRARLRSCEGR